MLSTDSILDFLKVARRDKMATAVIVGLMTDSVKLSVERLQGMLPVMKEMEEKSRPQKYKRNKTKRLEIDNDIATRIVEIVEELLPWLEQLAELEQEDEKEEMVIGLA